MTKKQAGKAPRHFITDGLQAYQKSSRNVFGKGTNHVRHIHLKGGKNNNKMERLNGEIRDSGKVFPGLNKMDTAILDGMWAYYNYTKKRGAIKGMTPTEAPLIQVDGSNKWKTIIQIACDTRKASSNVLCGKDTIPGWRPPFFLLTGAFSGLLLSLTSVTSDPLACAMSRLCIESGGVCIESSLFLPISDVIYILTSYFPAADAGFPTRED